MKLDYARRSDDGGAPRHDPQLVAGAILFNFVPPGLLLGGGFFIGMLDQGPSSGPAVATAVCVGVAAFAACVLNWRHLRGLGTIAGTSAALLTFMNAGLCAATFILLAIALLS